MTIEIDRSDEVGDWTGDSLTRWPVCEWPPQAAVDGDWIEFEVVTGSGRAARVRLRIRSNYVEVWSGDTCCGVFDRGTLRNWLGQLPRTPLMVGEVIFSVDRYVDSDGRVAITLPDVLAWTLSPMAYENLRALV